jgi:predicted acyltransferase
MQVVMVSPLRKISPYDVGHRFLSLDVFRGITIVMMILVNSPGNRVAYRWLSHSEWNGCSLADLVFPFFIVIVGVSSVVAFSNLRAKGVPASRLYGKLLRRSLFLFVMGLLLNAFMHSFDFANLRVMGVLQRIALCYFVSALLYLKTNVKTQLAIIVCLLIGYCLLLAWFTPADYCLRTLPIQDNLVGYVDRLLFSASHLYTPQFDPEGLLSTLPAFASVLLGNLLGMRLLSTHTTRQNLLWMSAVGIVLIVIGWVWSFYFPLNKAMWSSSYVLWTAGWAYLVFAICFALIEIKHWTAWSKPFVLFGRHALLVYMLHVLFLKIQAMILVHTSLGQVMNLRLYITEELFGYFSPYNASLAYAIFYTLIWFVILQCLEIGRTLLNLKRRNLAGV